VKKARDHALALVGVSLFLSRIKRCLHHPL
jgi:hypothetical protein